MVALALNATSATVVAVGQCADADAGTVVRCCCGTGQDTRAVVADLSGSTLFAATTAVSEVGLGVDASSGTNVQPTLAGELTRAAGADLARGALGSALTTVGKVGFGVDASSGTVGQTSLAGQLTFAIGANLA